MLGCVGQKHLVLLTPSCYREDLFTSSLGVAVPVATHASLAHARLYGARLSATQFKSQTPSLAGMPRSWEINFHGC